MAEKKTLEQLKAEAEKAQKAYDNAMLALAKKEKEEAELKEAKLAAEKEKRRKEIQDLEDKLLELQSAYIRDYGSYYTAKSYEKDGITSFFLRLLNEYGD